MGLNESTVSNGQSEELSALSTSPITSQSQQSSDDEVIKSHSALDVTVDNEQESVLRQPRESTRVRVKPSWMKDFVCQASSCVHDNKPKKGNSLAYTPTTYHFIVPKNFSSEHLRFVANIFVI